MSETALITLHEHDPAMTKIVAFLSEEATAGRVRFGVYHIRASKLGNLLRTIPAHIEGEEIALWAKSTATKLIAQAHDDADTLGGTVQGYAVVSEDQSGRPVGRQVFKIAVDTDLTEPPDEQGVTSQMMRHSELYARLIITGTARQQDGLLRTIERLEAENKRLHDTIAERDKARLKIFDLLEELQNQSVERETARAIGGVRAKMIERSGDGFAKLVPYALNHFAGKNILPTDDSGVGPLAKVIADSVKTDEQFTQLTAILGEHGCAALMTILKKSGALEVDPEKAKPNGKGDGEKKTDAGKDA